MARADAHVFRYRKPGIWDDISPVAAPVATQAHPLAAGPHGRLSMLSVGGGPSGPETLNALEYDPSAGWAAAVALASATTIGGDVAVLPDGTPLFLWSAASSSTCTPSYSLGETAGASAFPSSPSGCPFDRLVADRSGRAVAYEDPGANDIVGVPAAGPSVGLQWYDGKTWTGSALQGWDPGDSSDAPWNIAMGGGLFAAAQSATSRVVLFSPGSSQQEIDLPALPDSCTPSWATLVGMDAQGNVVAAWSGQCPGSGAGWHDRSFYARYTATSGWTSPTPIDDDLGTGISSFLALGVNDAGQAMTAWMTVHDNGVDPIALWLSPLP